MIPLPYCGSAPSPGELLGRFNLDPVLIIVLLVLGTVQTTLAGRSRRSRILPVCGWLVAGIAFVSPLCALSVALFSARIAQHMLLLLVAAPLIASGWTRECQFNVPRGGLALWGAAAAFMVALWAWHMPTPYDATFTATWIYWSMHITLLGSGILLWSELIHHPARSAGLVVTAGLLTSMQMGLLGSVLTLARRPLFYPHFTTTQVWGLTPLQDQQLGGTLMWVPGIVLFLWVAIRSLHRLWSALESVDSHESDPARLS